MFCIFIWAPTAYCFEEKLNRCCLRMPKQKFFFKTARRYVSHKKKAEFSGYQSLPSFKVVLGAGFEPA